MSHCMVKIKSAPTCYLYPVSSQAAGSLLLLSL